MRTFIFFAILSIIFPVISMAQKAAWSVELHGGLPYNIPAPLVIKQNNEETIRLTAHYRSEPMIAPIYWTGRISRLQNNALWEFETIHHKLFLDNTPPEVQFFSITHGYNIITLSRSYIKSLDQEHSIVIRIGAGIVLSHPENKIRDKEIDPKGGIFKMGYYLTGPVLNLAVGNRFYITKRIFVNGEIKFNPSFSRVPSWMDMPPYGTSRLLLYLDWAAISNALDQILKGLKRSCYRIVVKLKAFNLQICNLSP